MRVTGGTVLATTVCAVAAITVGLFAALGSPSSVQAANDPVWECAGKIYPASGSVKANADGMFSFNCKVTNKDTVANTYKFSVDAGSSNLDKNISSISEPFPASATVDPGKSEELKFSGTLTQANKSGSVKVTVKYVDAVDKQKTSTVTILPNCDPDPLPPDCIVESVGGIAEPVALTGDAASGTSGGSGPSAGALGAMAGGAAAAAALAVAGGWYARRRWME